MTYENVIDVEAVKERFMGNYQMFSKYLFQFAEGALYQKLITAAEAGDIQAAFETAHDMKGVTMNLSLKPLEEPMIAVVETLREGNLPDEAAWTAFSDSYQITVKCIGKLKDEGIKLF